MTDRLTEDPWLCGLLIGTAGLLLAGGCAWWASRRFGAAPERATSVGSAAMPADGALTPDRFLGPDLVNASFLPDYLSCIPTEKRHQRLRSDLKKVFGKSWPYLEKWLLPSRVTAAHRQHLANVRTSVAWAYIPSTLEALHEHTWDTLSRGLGKMHGPVTQAYQALYGDTATIHQKPSHARTSREQLLCWFDESIIPLLYPDTMYVTRVEKRGAAFRNTEIFSHTVWKLAEGGTRVTNAPLSTLGVLRRFGMLECPNFENSTMIYLAAAGAPEYLTTDAARDLAKHSTQRVPPT